MDVLTDAESEPSLEKYEVWNRKTWKAWGTPFLKDLSPLVFIDYPEEDKFQYIILTENESPEFVCPEPKIEVYPNANDGKIIKKLFSEDLKARSKEGIGNFC